jgi:hypothetical protein
MRRSAIQVSRMDEHSPKMDAPVPRPNSEDGR